MSLLFMYFIIW